MSLCFKHHWVHTGRTQLQACMLGAMLLALTRRAKALQLPAPGLWMISLVMCRRLPGYALRACSKQGGSSAGEQSVQHVQPAFSA